MVNPCDIQFYNVVESASVSWLWFPYIPYGKITIIQGDPGDGKTSLALYLASIVSRGGGMPLSGVKLQPQNVIYQNAEDGISDTIKPRLTTYGADCNRVCFVDETRGALKIPDYDLLDLIQTTKAKLLILDPLQAYLGETDMQRANNIRPIMKLLSNVAERTRCAVVLVGHMNKNDYGKDLYRGLGSIDIAAAARSIIKVSSDEEKKSMRYMTHIKSNLAPKGPQLTYELSNKGLMDWNVSDRTVEVPKSSKESAESALLNIVGENGVSSEEAYRAMAEKGFSRRTVERIKRKIGIISKRNGAHWMWFLQ